MPVWEEQKGWTFPWAEPAADTVSPQKPGTKIVVSNLRPEVASKFSSSNFIALITDLIKSKHRQFISDGLEVSLNGNKIDATDLSLCFSNDQKFHPGVEIFERQYSNSPVIKVKIVAGVGPSVPREAGWYVICNGRVVLEADRRKVTGWGLMEEEQNRILIPAFHNQFARFRGLVWFDSEDSSQVPWNTTKDDVDQDSAIWQETFEKMIQMTRPVISFLNELDRDIDEHTRERSPLLKYVNKAAMRKTEKITTEATFAAPSRDAVDQGPRYVKIQYSRPVDDVEFLQEELSVNSAKAVGEKAFDLIFARYNEE